MHRGPRDLIRTSLFRSKVTLVTITPTPAVRSSVMIEMYG